MYEGSINGVALQIRITQTGTNSYDFQLDASGVNPAAGLSNPIPLSLSIGNNDGSIQVNAGS